MKAVRRLLDHLALEMYRAAEDPCADAVHDLRVAVRRAAQGLRLFKDELPPTARRIRREIRAIRDHAAPVRDRDVTLQLLRRQRLPASDPACAYLAGQRAVAAENLVRYLRRRLKRQRPAKWATWLEAAP